jgi:hypothetical protein
MVLPLLIMGAFRESRYKETIERTVMRKKNFLSSGYHARLRAINPDFFPALSDVAADPRPGFDLEAELCSQVVPGHVPKI